MSLFFSRMQKLSVRYSSDSSYRFFSSLRPSPYILRGYTIDSDENVEVYAIRATKIDSPGLLIKDRKLPQQSEERPVGISGGWAAFMDKTKGGPMWITDVFKPWVSSPRCIQLPPLGFVPTHGVSSLLSLSWCDRGSEVSLSYCDPCDEHGLVAGMFTDDKVSVCKPAGSEKWTHIEDHVEDRYDHPLFPANKLMYSKRDKTFYFTCDFGFQLGSIDVSNKKLDSQFVHFGTLPDLENKRWDVLEWCIEDKHLVESPSGELFYILWYTYLPPIHQLGELDRRNPKTKRFMVFKQDEKSELFHYTEDIGDLSIFLSQRGQGEDFCVTASMYSGLKPNSIYFQTHSMNSGIGSYNIASCRIRRFPFDAKFWIPPIWVRLVVVPPSLLVLLFVEYLVLQYVLVLPLGILMIHTSGDHPF